MGILLCPLLEVLIQVCIPTTTITTWSRRLQWSAIQRLSQDHVTDFQKRLLTGIWSGGLPLWLVLGELLRLGITTRTRHTDILGVESTALRSIVFGLVLRHVGNESGTIGLTGEVLFPRLCGITGRTTIWGHMFWGRKWKWFLNLNVWYNKL